MSPTAVFNCAALVPPLVIALIVLFTVASALLGPPARWCLGYARVHVTRGRQWWARRRAVQAAAQAARLARAEVSVR